MFWPFITHQPSVARLACRPAPGDLFKFTIGIFRASWTQFPDGPKVIDVSPVDRELIMSTSVLNTRPMLPAFAISFMNSHPGSRLNSSPPRASANPTICMLVL